LGALAIVFFVACLILNGTWFVLAIRNIAVPRIELLFSMLLATGTILSYTAIVFWYLVPTSVHICLARVFLTSLGYTLILASIFTRLWQLHRIYQTVHKQQRLTTRIRAVMEVTWGVLIILVLQFIFLIVWATEDPYTNELYLTDPINLLAEWKCNSKHFSIWIGVELTFFGLLLVWGVVVIYRSWTYKVRTKEPKWLLISIYNFFLSITVLITLFSVLDLNDDSVCYTVVVVMVFSITSVTFCVYFPKLVNQTRIYASSATRSRTTTSSVFQTSVESTTRTNDSTSIGRQNSIIVADGYSEEAADSISSSQTQSL